FQDSEVAMGESPHNGQVASQAPSFRRHPHSRYKNSFEQNSIWQKLCQADWRASGSGRPAARALPAKSRINAVVSRSSSGVGGRPRARVKAEFNRTVSVALASARSDLAK